MPGASARTPSAGEGFRDLIDSESSEGTKPDPQKALGETEHAAAADPEKALGETETRQRATR